MDALRPEPAPPSNSCRPDGDRPSRSPDSSASATRRYRGQRALRIASRTVHIGAAGVTLGAALFGGRTEIWHALLVASGLYIMGDDVYRYGSRYFRYLQSWSILFKLAVLAAAAIWPAFLIPAFWIALVIGSVISHAPGAIRHFALWGRPGPCA